MFALQMGVLGPHVCTFSACWGRVLNFSLSRVFDDVRRRAAEGVKDILVDVETRRRWMFMFIVRYDTYAISLLADEAV